MNDVITIKVSKKTKSIQKAARRAFKHHLYQHHSWLFSEILQNPECIFKIAIAYVGKHPVGVSIYWTYELLDDYIDDGYEHQLGCFVHSDYRRNGIGRMLVNRMKTPSDVCVGIGLDSSKYFWETVKPEAEFQ